MSHMTTFVFLGDAEPHLKKNEQIGNTLSSLIRKAKDMPIGCLLSDAVGAHANAIRLVSQHHSDMVSVILVGGNMAKEIGRVNNSGGCHDRKSVVEVLRAVVAGLGFEMVPVHMRPDGVKFASMNRRLEI